MGQIIFNKNGITSRHCSIWKILWEYICWVLAGKPENHTIGEFEDDKRQG